MYNLLLIFKIILSILEIKLNIIVNILQILEFTL